MPRLIIDDITVEVPEGTNVLEAARSTGIVIPHFCWHPALGKAGACRVCAVKMLDGPVKGLQMSCMLPAQDGMVVSTTDPEAAAMRRSVIEWLMINHPHDCPVCDEGGECQLQDFTIAGGHGIRRYDGRKRTYSNQYLGECIEHEMNRCIQCYRCARFYQEYAGGNDFGVTGRADTVYFGRQQDGQLESPFSGNLVDICPTGVFTDKTARFRARYWDYDMAPSVCPHCSLGCNTIPMSRYRELLKTVARRNDAVNGWFICDKGRFSNAAVNAPDRPRQALVDGKPATMDEALDALVERLSEFMELHGPGSLTIVGSPRMSLEGNIMAARLKGMLDAGTLSYFGDVRQAGCTDGAVSLLATGNAASQEDVRRADLVAVMGCDLLAEAPMMALAVRQAWRNGARIFLVNLPPRPQGEGRGEGFVLPFDFTTVTSLTDVPLSEAVRPVIISGNSEKVFESLRMILSTNTPPLAKGGPGGISTLGHETDPPQSPFVKGGLQTEMPPGIKLACIVDAPNTIGCALLAREHGALPLAQALAESRVKGIISLETDLPDNLPEGVRVLGAADWRPTWLLSRAEVVLPTCAWVEQDGIFVNNEGRAQRFRQVMHPGLPIRGHTPELHPPRVHRHDAPGGDVLPAWRIVAEVIARLGGERIDTPLDGGWERLQGLEAEGAGEVLNRPA